MSDHEPLRDLEVARALGAIPVPEYEPGFWDRLGARLEHDGGPASAPDVPDLVVVPHDDLPTPAPPAQRSERRRSVALLVAAAAAILAIVAVGIGFDDGADVRMAGEGGAATEVAPEDGTTTADVARSEVGGTGEPDDGGPDPRGGDASDAAQGPRPVITFFPSSTVVGGTGGPGGSATEAAPRTLTAAPKTAEETFLAWASAIDRGDVEEAARLTGPRTARYYESLGTSATAMAAEAGGSWGVWADPDGRRIQPVELGQVDGERVVGLVLDRPTDDPQDADGRAYEGVPVVRGADGWRVEPAAFDPARDGRIEVRSPAPGPTGFGDLPKGGAIRVAAQRTGEYYLNLDFSKSVRIPAADAVDGEITWDPGGQHSDIVHLLVVAHLDDGQVVMLAQTFESAPA